MLFCSEYKQYLNLNLLYTFSYERAEVNHDRDHFSAY